MEAIKTVALTKNYKNLTAVDSLDLQIRSGELFTLLGVNGAGKSTTIRLLSCLTQPTSGDAWVGGNRITEEPLAVKSVIGVSPQETAVAPNLSVKENLELMCGIHGFSKEKSREKIASLSERFGLGSILDKKAGILSGGWQRRLSIAMALISEPEILFLDDKSEDVVGKCEEFTLFADQNTVFYPAFGNNEFRLQWLDRLEKSGCAVANVVSPNAYISPTVNLDYGVVVLPGAIVNTNTKVGRGCIGVGSLESFIYCCACTL